MIIVGSAVALFTLAVGIAILVGTVLDRKRASATAREYDAAKRRRAVDVKRLPPD